MPFDVSSQITIDVPAEQVFPLVSDITNWPDITTQSVSHTSGPRTGVGSVYTVISSQQNGSGYVHTSKTIFTTKEYTPPTKCVWTSSSRMSGPSVDTTNELLERMGDVECHISVQPSGYGCTVTTTTKGHTFCIVKNTTIKGKLQSTIHQW